MNNKIYIVLHTLSIGGAERHASSIANYLVKHGYSVTVVLLDDSIVAYDLLNNVSVVALCDMHYPARIQNYKPSLISAVKLKAYSILSQKKYNTLDKYLYLYANYISKLEYFFSAGQDVGKSTVISFMPIPNIVCSAIKPKFNFKLILGEFSSPHLEYAEDSPENQLKRKLFVNADGFVFQTEEQRGFYNYLSSVKKVIIPNPIEEITVRPFEGRRRKEIVNFCRLVKAKNIPLLIEAFSRIASEFPDYSLALYGDGPEKESIVDCIKCFGLDSHVHLNPFEKNVLERVRESAMFVSSSNREGISNSMLEAMAIGLPVICTDCPAGGARMMIRTYENGILVPVNDPDALYQAMKYMIEHPADAARMAKEAVTIREILNKEIIMSKWKSFIESI